MSRVVSSQSIVDDESYEETFDDDNNLNQESTEQDGDNNIDQESTEQDHIILSDGKSSAGSSDGCTTVDEETRLIEQSKLYIEGPGIRQNYKNVNEHNSRIGEKLKSLHSHQQAPPPLPSPILARPTNGKQDVIVAPAQSSSPVKIKTVSRITFALPPQIASPNPTNVFESVHPPSPQIPPTTTATSIDTQTDDLSHPTLYEKQCQTGPIEIKNQLIQTDSINTELVSIGIQCQSNITSDQHIVGRDLTVCTCVEQLVKTRQFLVDTSTKFIDQEQIIATKCWYLY